jgi:hypothetical protein
MIMPDTLAGRRALEFFGLLAITPAANKKQETNRWPFVTPMTKKLAHVDRPRKSK